MSGWGITYDWPEKEPGPIPMTDEEHVLIKDIEDWREYVKAPDLSTKDSDWDDYRARARAVNNKEQFRAAFFAPGTFEYTHSMLSFEDSLCNLLVYPDEMHELIDYITDWRCAYMEEVLKHVPEVEMVFCHDDWGSKLSTFMSPEVFHEFYTPAYKKLYGVAKGPRLPGGASLRQLLHHSGGRHDRDGHRLLGRLPALQRHCRHPEEDRG